MDISNYIVLNKIKLLRQGNKYIYLKYFAFASFLNRIMNFDVNGMVVEDRILEMQWVDILMDFLDGEYYIFFII